MPFVSVENNIIQSIKMEFNLNFHCNLSCAECSRNSPHLRPQFASLEKFKKDVAAIEKVYHVKRFRFEGGEPLLNRKILYFVEVVRESKLADQLHVHTNGLLLHRADKAFFREIDILSISRYPDVRCNDRNIQLAKDMCERYGTELRIEKIRGFRSINMDDALDVKLKRKIFNSCQIAHSWYCQTFYDGMFYLCSRPLCTQNYRTLKNLKSPDLLKIDGIHIHSPELFYRLKTYLERKEPLLSCSYCLGSVGLHQAWRSLSVDECRHPVFIKEPAMDLIEKQRLSYLTHWAAFQEMILQIVPLLSLARLLTMLRDAPFYRSRNKPLN